MGFYESEQERGDVICPVKSFGGAFGLAKVTANEDQVERVTEFLEVLAFEFEPERGAFVGLVV